MDEVIYDKLAAVGLVASRTSTKLAAFINTYTRERKDVKRATLTCYGHTRRGLAAFFGEDKTLREITKGDTDQWRAYLVGEGLSDNTVRRRCGIAK